MTMIESRFWVGFVPIVISKAKILANVSSAAMVTDRMAMTVIEMRMGARMTEKVIVRIRARMEDQMARAVKDSRMRARRSRVTIGRML
jgi:hypothetical protein